jgi:lipid-binding SYLF domain-containing protein
MHRLYRYSAVSTAILAFCAVSPIQAASHKEDVVERLSTATAVFKEIMDTPDKGIPQDLLERSHCVVIVPGMKKGAFVIGAQYGKGFMTCRSKTSRNGWSAPGAIRVEGGSVGFQIGGSETDVVMLVMNDRGASKLLSSQFTLGGEGEVAAGPVGRSAEANTDAKFQAEILSWSRSRGVFAGLALKGATLRQDTEDNEALYGRKLDNRTIVMEGIATPPEARPLLDMLGKYSFRELKG